MTKLNTTSVSLAVTPTVVSTLFSHVSVAHGLLIAKSHSPAAFGELRLAVLSCRRLCKHAHAMGCDLLVGSMHRDRVCFHKQS